MDGQTIQVEEWCEHCQRLFIATRTIQRPGRGREHADPMPGLLPARVVPAQPGLAVKATFYIVGAVVEFVGILLVASPDLVPFADRVAAWSRPRVRAIKKRLGLRTRSDVNGYYASDSVTVSDRASAVVSSGANTLEGKVEFLLRRDADAQQHMNKLVERVMDLEERVTRETDTLRHHAEGRIESRIEETQWEYRVVRWCGVGALVVGLGLSTAGNLVH
jgi:hypothetical protein